MNILLINHYAGTPALGMEYRPYYLAREWVRAGHEVRILAADHSHVRARQPAAGDETVDGIRYRWYPTPAYRGNGFGRLANIASFLRQVSADAPRLVAEARWDAVIASSTYPLDFRVARGIARRTDAALVHEVHDLWPLSLVELSGLPRWHPFVLLCAEAERTACREADAVVSMLPKVQDHMAARGLDLAKLHIVPNGIAPDDWLAPPVPLRADVAAALAAARDAGLAVVGYAGSMGLPNALDTLLDAADRLREAPLQFLLAGDGHEKARLAERAAALKLERVVFLPPVPKAQVPALLAGFDIAYIGWQPKPIYRFGIAPNKLMDYLMAERCVLHAVQAGNDPVAEAGCGLTVPPGDAEAVADGLARLAALTPAERRAMGERGRAFVLAHHAYPVLARRFLDALQTAR